MTQKFKKYLLADGCSMTGNWLRIVLLNWVTINEVGGQSTQNLLRGGIISLIPVLLLFVPVKRLRVGPILIVSTAFAAATSVVLAYLSWTRQLSLEALYIFDFANGILAVYGVPAMRTYFKDISPPNKTVAQFMKDNRFWFARMAAGMLALPLVNYGTWILFVIDAVSFVPLLYVIIESVYSAESRAGRECAPVPVDIVAGWMTLIKTGKGLVVVALTSIDGVLSGLCFVMSAEMLGREHRASLRSLAVWLVVTGFSAFVGSYLGGRLVKNDEHRDPKRKISIRLYFACTFACFACIFAVGLAPTTSWFITFYMLANFFGAPMKSLSDAHFLGYLRNDLSSIERVVSANQTLECWIRYGIATVGGYFGLLAGQTLSVTAAISFVLVLLILLGSRIAAPHTLENWHSDEPDPA